MTSGNNETRKRLLCERWAILRNAGVPAYKARDARTSSAKFRAALLAIGVDPEQFPPHLLNTNQGQRRSYSMAPAMVVQRRRRAKLKAMGLDFVRCDTYSRSAKSMRRAMLAVHEGREIPEHPSMLDKE